MRPCVVDERRTKEAIVPLGGAADEFFAHYSPRGEPHESAPSGVPKVAQPPAMGWFFLVVMAVASSSFSCGSFGLTAISRNKWRPIDGRCGSSTRTGRRGRSA